MTASRRSSASCRRSSGAIRSAPPAASSTTSPDLGFALETQTRPVYSQAFFNQDFSPLESPGDSVVVHELAHQWAGDDVALAAWRHIWLNEGFATYMEWLWSEREGRDSAQELFDVFAAIAASSSFWQVEIGDPGPDDLFTSRSTTAAR